MRRKIDGQTAFAYTRKRLGLLIGKLRNRGGFLPTERMLCDEIDVSRDTLKSAIDSFVKDGLLEVRPRKGNYVIKATPLNFRVGLMTGTGEMPFFGSDKAFVIAGALEVFANNRLSGIHQMHTDTPENIAGMARQYALDGILWIEPAPDCVQAFEQLLDTEIPTLATISSFRGMTLPSNYVGFDHIGNGRVKATHLLSLGCRKIAYAYIKGRNDAHEGFKAELRNAGFPLKPEMLMPDLDAVKERLPALLRRGGIDGIAAEGGEELIETLFSILDEESGASPEIVIDFVSAQRFRFAGRRDPKLFLNVMPFKRIGIAAAEHLLKAKGKQAWRMKPELLTAEVVPSVEIPYAQQP